MLVRSLILRVKCLVLTFSVPPSSSNYLFLNSEDGGSDRHEERLLPKLLVETDPFLEDRLKRWETQCVRSPLTLTFVS